MDIRPVDFTVDDDYDVCGNTVVAVLEGRGIKIHLCKDCLNDLEQSMDEFHKTIFCCSCKHFRMSSSGFRYGGSCQLRSNVEIKPKDYGHVCCVDSMHTCKDAEYAYM